MKSALERLASNWQIIASSGTYITEPVGFTEQQEFLNAAVKFRCEEEPLQLFQRLKELEAELGRIARERWHEREIDFDILFYDDLILKSDILTIPHPEALRRNFVLIPLIEIAPDLHDPASAGRSHILLRIS
jgi:2-amino-4-hydroxy-6-hydroxymethyldihydropteridine diphosphokinase